MYEDNSSSGNKGNRGKFSDRLKKIRKDRLKKKGSFNTEEEARIKTTGRNVLKVVLAMPSMIYANITDKVNGKNDIETKKEDEDRIQTRQKHLNKGVSSGLILHENLDNVLDNDITNQEVRRIRVNKIKDIDVSLLKNEVVYRSKKRGIVLNDEGKEIKYNLEDEFNKIKIQKEIIDLIKKKLVKNINELEILQSELYVLNELGYDESKLSECQENIKEIKKLLSKIKALKEKYDYLKDNVDFEYMLEYEDSLLVDKILELKELCTRDDIRQTVADYKILDEYKFLYLKIDELQEETIRLEEYKNEKAEELKKRDIDFDKLKSDIYDVDRESEKYDSFVKRQELLLRELDEKMRQIDSCEKVTYKLKGFNQLLGNSFKYLGLLLVNPLKGLVPGIATQTLVTKNLIHNLYNNLEWEENRKMVYDAIDYSTSINVAINNLDDTASLVDTTLEDIVRLKAQYKKEFSKYEGEFASYHEAIKKINKIENAVLGNKIKIEMMRKRMKEKERQNNNRLKMVKKLNSSNNS